MRASNEIDKIAAALVAIQKQIDPIAKDAVNPHFKSAYLTLDTMTEYLRPILAAEGVAIVQGGGDTESGVALETMLLHSSGQWISSTVAMPLEKGTAQSAGSAITYGRRYGLAAILALAADEDDDGNKATATARQPERSAPKPSAASPLAGVTACPKCGGDCWDNRKTKTNPKQPDFKCKDKSCDGVIWPSQKPEPVRVGPAFDEVPDEEYAR